MWKGKVRKREREEGGTCVRGREGEREQRERNRKSERERKRAREIEGRRVIQNVGRKERDRKREGEREKESEYRDREDERKRGEKNAYALTANIAWPKKLCIVRAASDKMNNRT